MKRTLILGLVVGLGVYAWAAFGAGKGDGSFNMGVKLEGLKLGKPISGPTVTLDDLKNHVVLLEFWGTRCPPCLASLPHLEAWQKEYQNQGLIIIGTESQGSSEEAIRKVVADKGVSFTIVQNSMVEGGDDFSGIPHCMLFDHTGKCVFRGHPGEVESKLKDALAAAPAAALAGRDFKKLGNLAVAYKNGESSASILKKAQAKTESSDPDTADEAKWIVEKLTEYGNKQLESAKSKMSEDPLACFTTMQKLAGDFKGTDIGKTAAETVATLKKDKSLTTELAAQDMLAKIRTLEAGMKGKDSAPSSASFKNQNGKLLQQMQASLQVLVKKYPNTKAVTEAEQLAKRYDLSLSN